MNLWTKQKVSFNIKPNGNTWLCLTKSSKPGFPVGVICDPTAKVTHRNVSAPPIYWKLLLESHQCHLSPLPHSVLNMHMDINDSQAVTHNPKWLCSHSYTEQATRVPTATAFKHHTQTRVWNVTFNMQKRGKRIWGFLRRIFFPKGPSEKWCSTSFRAYSTHL